MTVETRAPAFCAGALVYIGSRDRLQPLGKFQERPPFPFTFPAHPQPLKNRTKEVPGKKRAFQCGQAPYGKEGENQAVNSVYAA